MSQPKTKVAMSCLHKIRLYKALSPEICVSVLEVGRQIQLSVCVCVSLSLYSNLLKHCCICLSNSTYLKTVLNSIKTSWGICIFYSIFGLESKVFPVMFNTLSALISLNWMVHFRIKFALKVFYGICRMRNRLAVSILWCKIICKIIWEIV